MRAAGERTIGVCMLDLSELKLFAKGYFYE